MSKEVLPTAPYKGLIPYSEEDANFFFGREPEREIITANLMASRLTLLYGASGVGKSSVLRAGVAHHLRRLARENLAKRGVAEFAVVVFREWRDNPLGGLAAEVQASVARTLGEPVERVSTSGNFSDIMKTAANRIGGRLLIILDQFEEYFLYHAQEDGEGTFAVEFPRAVNTPDLPVSFMISIREDALAKLDRFEGRIPNLFDNYLRVEHLDRDSAREAIIKPIDQYNRLVPVGGQMVSIEPALVEEVLNQVQTGKVGFGEAGRGVVSDEDEEDETAQIETPFLQLVMTRLWNEEMQQGSRLLRLETLNDLGGAKSIIKTHLDEAMSGLTVEEQDVASRIFRYLVTPSGTKIAHSSGDLAEYVRLRQEQLTPVLEELSSGDNRILRPVAPPPDEAGPLRYEIFHDVLAPAILDYAKARERIEAERQLELEAKERAKAEKQLAREQRLVRRQRWSLILMGLLVLAMIGITAYAFEQRASANTARKEADEQRDEAQSQRIAAVEARFVAENASAETGKALGREAEERKRAEAQRVAAVVAKVEADSERARAEEQRVAAVNAKEEADSERVRAEQAQAVAQSGEKAAMALAQLPIDPQLSLGMAMEAARIAPTPQAEKALRRALLDSYSYHELRGHTGLVKGTVFSPDGKHIVTTGEDNTARVWDAVTGGALGSPLIHSEAVERAAFNRDGDLLLTVTNKHAQVWKRDDTGWENVKVIDPTGFGDFNAAFTPDGRSVVIVKGNDAQKWDMATGQTVELPKGDLGYRGSNVDHRFSSDGRLGFSNNRYGKASVWEASTGQILKEMTEVTILGVGSDGRFILARKGAQIGQSDDKKGTLQVIDWNTGRAEKLPGDEDVEGRSGIVSPDSKSLIVFGSGSTAQLWNRDASTWRKAPDPLKHSDNIVRAEFSRDGRFIVTVSLDGTARVWEASTGKLVTTLRGHTGSVTDASFSPDGKSVVTVSADTTGRVWESGIDRIGTVAVTETISDINDAGFVSNDKFFVTARNRTMARRVELPISGNGEAVEKSVDTGGPTLFEKSVLFSPDGRFFAASGPDNEGHVWDITKNQEVINLRGHREQITSAAYSPDGRLIATSDRENTHLWDGATGHNVKVLEGGEAAFSSDGRFILTVLPAEAFVWNAATMRRIARLPHALQSSHQEGIRVATISPDGRLVITVDPYEAKVWQVPTASGEEVVVQSGLELKAQQPPVLGAAFTPDGKFIVTFGMNTARVWEVPAQDMGSQDMGSILNNSIELPGRVSKVAFSPDSKYFVAVTPGSPQVWEIDRASPGERVKKVVEMQGIMGSVIAATFSPDGRFVVTVSLDSTVRVWEASTGKMINAYLTPIESNSTARFSTDGKLIFISNASGETHAWQWEERRGANKSVTLRGYLAATRPGGNFAVIIGTDESAWLYDSNTGQKVSELTGHIRRITSREFSPDGKKFVTASEDNNARVWDTSTGKKQSELRGHAGPIVDAKFSHDGRLLVTASKDQTARVWDVATGQSVAVLPGATKPLTSASFSPDGRFVVAWSRDSIARLWAVPNTRGQTELESTSEALGEHTGDLTSVSFSPDSKLVVITSADKTARVWEHVMGNTWKRLSVLQHTKPVSNARFSPDSKLVLTESDSEVRVWDATTGESLFELRGHTARNIKATFSPDSKMILTVEGERARVVSCEVCGSISDLLKLAERRISKIKR
jgi:WD40 repeat protein